MDFRSERSEHQRRSGLDSLRGEWSMTFAKIGMTAALAAGLLTSTSAFADALVEGTWLTPDQAEMTIEECEQGLCGTLSKIVITQAHVQQYGVDASAIDIESITDVMNKDPA